MSTRGFYQSDVSPCIDVPNTDVHCIFQSDDEWGRAQQPGPGNDGQRGALGAARHEQGQERSAGHLLGRQEVRGGGAGNSKWMHDFRSDCFTSPHRLL